jgi:hypothetical protein
MLLKFDNIKVGEILEASKDVNALIDGSTFMLASVNPSQNPFFVAHKPIGKYGARFGLVWNNAADMFILRKKSGHPGLKMSPNYDQTLFMGAKTTLGNPNRWISWEKDFSRDSTNLKVKYNRIKRGFNGSAGSISIGYYGDNNNNMATSGSTDGSISSVRGDQWMVIVFTVLGDKLAEAYNRRMILEKPELQRDCCLRNYSDAVTDVSCSVLGFEEGGGKCDKIASDYCKLHPTDRMCICINSPLKDITSLTVGCDKNCVREEGIYVTAGLGRDVDKGCPFIECSQQINITDEQKKLIRNFDIQQDCSTTQDETRDSTTYKNTEVPVTDDEPEPAPEPMHESVPDDASLMERIDRDVLRMFPKISDIDFKLEKLNERKGLSSLLLMILLLVLVISMSAQQSQRSPQYQDYNYW